MKFSKEQFRKNADKHTQRLIADHVVSMDGNEVVFKDGDDYGICWYMHEEKEFMLYPVFKSWCDEEQLSIFEGV